MADAGPKLVQQVLSRLVAVGKFGEQALISLPGKEIRKETEKKGQAQKNEQAAEDDLVLF